MGLMEQAQADIKRITSDTNGFAKACSFVSEDGLQSATISGIHSKIHLSIDTQGAVVNSKKAHLSFSESLLTDQGYTTRVNGLCILKDHLVTVTDSTGTAIQYVVEQVFPDETIGLLVLILGDYTP